jgi:hypothetical protein
MLFAFSGYCELCYNGHGSANAFLTLFSLLLAIYLKVGVLDHVVYLYLVL